jgi:MGT family glycosyltransferase
MSSFLFCAWDGGGAVFPTLSLARAMVERGQDVRVLGDPVLRAEIEAAGAEPIAWTRTPHRAERRPETDLFKDWEARTPMGAFTRIRDRLMFGHAADVARDVTDELQRRPADVIVTEVMLAGALVAGEAAGVPVALITTTVDVMPAPGRPPFGPGLRPASGPLGRLRDSALDRFSRSGWNRGLPALNAARAEFGLQPVDDAVDSLGRVDRVLALTSDAFDYPELPRHPKVRVVGPRLDDPDWAGELSLPPGDAPLVLVGFSSTYQEQDEVLRRAATALGTLPVRGLVTTGPAVPSFAAAGNVSVVEAAPHAAVLPHTAVVVTHGGHGTVMKALAAGVPMVVMPMGRDQPENATRLLAAGAGVRIKRSASPDKIAAAVRKVLGDESYRAAAQRLAAAIAEETAEDRAAAELEELAVQDSGSWHPSPQSRAAVSAAGSASS